jgi:hypothetical protein
MILPSLTPGVPILDQYRRCCVGDMPIPSGKDRFSIIALILTPEASQVKIRPDLNGLLKFLAPVSSTYRAF